MLPRAVYSTPSFPQYTPLTLKLFTYTIFIMLYNPLCRNTIILHYLPQHSLLFYSFLPHTLNLYNNLPNFSVSTVQFINFSYAISSLSLNTVQQTCTASLFAADHVYKHITLLLSARLIHCTPLPNDLNASLIFAKFICHCMCRCNQS